MLYISKTWNLLYTDSFLFGGGGVVLILIFRYEIYRNFMFFWPCIMNWLYINYQLDELIIIYS